MDLSITGTITGHRTIAPGCFSRRSDGAAVQAFHTVQRARLAQQSGVVGASVHRSSMLAPKLAGAATQIAFLNHFLIKRGIQSITCRISAVDVRGARVGATTLEIDAPIVYALALEELLPGLTDVSQYIVEF